MTPSSAPGIGRPADLRIQAATTADIPLVRELAGRSWHAFYPGIISMPQIHTMLRTMYSPHRIRSEMEEGSGYHIARLNAVPVGFLSHDPPRKDLPLMLQKLYLVPEYQGQGHGRAMLDWLAQHALDLGLKRIVLRVNKHNSRAQRAYRRAGYRPVDAMVTPIGQGHVMDDYLFERRLT